MWGLYDKLIEPISKDIIVTDYVSGGHFSCLEAGALCGVAYSTSGDSRPAEHPEGPIGRSLYDVAKGVCSWNYEEATAGAAAINAWYNSGSNRERAGFAVTEATPDEAKEKHNYLSNPPKEMCGKKLGMIGHFRNAERLAEYCDLYILERRPQSGDYPDSACEYLLPEMDYIYATGMTLINKTLPRLLQLKKPGAKFILLGPTGVLAPALLEAGVDTIASFVIDDPEMVKDVIVNNRKGMFKAGRMVEYSAK